MEVDFFDFTVGDIMADGLQKEIVGTASISSALNVALWSRCVKTSEVNGYEAYAAAFSTGIAVTCFTGYAAVTETSPCGR